MQEFKRVLQVFRRAPKEDRQEVNTENLQPQESAVDQAAREILPRLSQLIKDQGVTRFTLSRGLSPDTVPITHTDIVMRAEDESQRLGAENKQQYLVSLLVGPTERIQIADFKVQEGIERAMLFEGNDFKGSAKCKKVGSTRTYEHGQVKLSKEEVVKFLNEVNRAKFDPEATRNLPR